jgi:hypothetical protein
MYLTWCDGEWIEKVTTFWQKKLPCKPDPGKHEPLPETNTSLLQVMLSVIENGRKMHRIHFEFGKHLFFVSTTTPGLVTSSNIIYFFKKTISDFNLFIDTFATNLF